LGKTGINPHAVSVGDFNGDGNPDIVSADMNLQQIGIFLNNGNGTFAASVPYTTGTTPYGVAVGDFNGDGKLDIVSADFNSLQISVFLNNGNGTFAARVPYTTGTTPYAVSVGDFNGDGKPDIVTADQGSDQISVFINNGNGAFAARVPYATGSNPYNVAVGDFNGDGKLDIVSADYSAAQIGVFLNNGDGTFAARVPYTTVSGARSVACGDFNGDGKPDIVSADFSGTSISVFINNGDGTFAARVPYATGSNPISVSVGDFNGDGKLDIVSADYVANEIGVFLNNGNGTFAVRAPYTTGSFPVGVAVGDFNSDGKPDIVSADNNSSQIGVFLNTGNFPQIAVGKLNQALVFNTASTITSANSQFAFSSDSALQSSNAARTLALWFKTASSSSTGRYQYAFTYGTNSSSQAVQLGVGTDGTIGTNALFLSVNGTILGTTPNLHDNQWHHAAATYNGTTWFLYLDGIFKTSQAITTNTVKTGIAYLGKNLIGDSNFWNGSLDDLRIYNYALSATEVASLGKTSTVAVGISPIKKAVGSDLMAYWSFDGKSMSTSTITDLSGNGRTASGTTRTVSFANRVPYTDGATSYPYSVATADFNGDGKVDIVTADSYNFAGSQGTLSVFMNNGNGLFATRTATFAGNYYATYVSPGDFNNDGKMDFVSTNWTDTALIQIFTNSGNGTFTSAGAGTGAATRMYETAVADLSGDGWPDIVTAAGNAFPVRVFINNANGTFQSGVGYTAAGPYKLAVGDFDNDGKIDIVTANSETKTISILRNLGSGTFAAKADYTANTDYPQDVSVADFNGDGYQDVVTPDGSANQMSVYLNSGTGTFPTHTSYTTGTYPNGVSVGDFNGDGKPDIVTDDNGGTISVFLNNGNGTFASRISYTTGTSPYGVAVADFNGDGKSDIVTANFNNTSDQISVFQNRTNLITETVGRFGQGISLGGSGDCVHAGSFLNLQDFTQSFWVRPRTTQTPFAPLMDNGHSTTTVQKSFAIEQNGTTTANYINQYYYTFSDTSEHKTNLFTLNPNIFQNLILTQNGTTHVGTVYLNGVEVSSTTGTGNITYNGTEYLRFGCSTTTIASTATTSRFWGGKLDDLRIYNRAYSRAEVSDLYKKIR
jgi:hypothetical protein